MPKENLKQISVYIPVSLHKKVKTIAVKKDMTIKALIIEMITKGVSNG